MPKSEHSWTKYVTENRSCSPHMPPDQLVESLSNYFIEKITRIRNDLNEQVFDLPPELPELDPDEAAAAEWHRVPKFQSLPRS